MKRIDLKRLDSARVDLAAAEANLRSIEGRETAALETQGAFAAWQRYRQDAASEVERLSCVVSHLDKELSDQIEGDNRLAFQKRVDAQVRANAALARRIREEGGAAAAQLLKLARDVASAAIEDEKLNALLPADAEHIRSADAIARFKAAQPRENIAEKSIELWVFASNGNLVGNQGDVVERPDGSGIIPPSKTKCAKRKFRSIRYFEAERAQQIEPLFAALCLPNFDGPGMVWDGSRISRPAKALEVLDREPAERQELVELIPVEPWVSRSDVFSHSFFKEWYGR